MSTEKNHGFASTSSVRIAFKPNGDGLNSHSNSNCNLSRNLFDLDTKRNTNVTCVFRSVFPRFKNWDEKKIQSRFLMLKSMPRYFAVHTAYAVSGGIRGNSMWRREIPQNTEPKYLRFIWMWAVRGLGACVQIHQMCKIQCFKLMDVVHNNNNYSIIISLSIDLTTKLMVPMTNWYRFININSRSIGSSSSTNITNTKNDRILNLTVLKSLEQCAHVTLKHNNAHSACAKATVTHATAHSRFWRDKINVQPKGNK